MASEANSEPAAREPDRLRRGLINSLYVLLVFTGGLVAAAAYRFVTTAPDADPNQHLGTLTLSLGQLFLAAGMLLTQLRRRRLTWLLLALAFGFMIWSFVLILLKG